MSYKPQNTEERILHRLKIVKGHLEKVISMVEKDQYCIDVIHQSQAVQKALKEIDNLMLQNHLEKCATDAIRAGDQKKAVEEVMHVFRKIP